MMHMHHLQWCVSLLNTIFAVSILLIFIFFLTGKFLRK